MDNDFLSGFSPKLLDVLDRDESFWLERNHKLQRDPTRLHILAYVYGGEGVLQVQGKEWPLSPGMVFQVWPKQRMEIVSSKEHPLKFHSVHYLYGLLRWEAGRAQWREGLGAIPFDSLQLDAAGQPELKYGFQRLYELWNQKANGYEWQAKLIFLDLVRLLAELSSEVAWRTSPSTASIQEAIRYMTEHYREDLFRDELAQHVSLSPAHFSTLFKKHTGYSPIQYLNRLRLDHAKRLLRQSSLSISQVAEAVGYADSFYFSRLFSKETGLSPREYREA